MKTSQFAIVLSLLLVCGVVRAADPKYPVSAIPPDLLQNANAVVRTDEIVFSIISRGEAKAQYHYAVTIFNEKAKDMAELVVFYDKLTKITDLKATVYDATGKQIKKVKMGEMRDQSMFDGFSLYSDNRLKWVDLTQGTYPYTVEFEYQENYNFLFSIPTSQIIPAESISVENFSYVLIFPKALEPKYQLVNVEGSPIRSPRADGTETLTWTFKNLLPMKPEPYSPPVFPKIIAAPNAFEFEGYEGSMASWNDFGKWIASLNKGRDMLPESTKAMVRSLVANASTTEEKVKKIYEYLQNKTRYVSIQLGIGGFQPFEASLVDANGYGDCKALSNYTVSMLQSVGIKAHYALIYAGPNYPGLKEDFTSSQFNHAIVAVPNGKDTLWLECTSQTNPFGYQGKFTGDRKALLITDNGAAIVKTTQYPAELNQQFRSAEVNIDITGDATAKVKTVYTGLQYENDNLDHILTTHADDQKKWLQNHTAIPTFDIVGFSMENKKEKLPAGIVNIDLRLRRFGTLNGKRVFITPNLMNRNTFIPEKVDSRKSPVVRKNAYVDCDTIRYSFPEQLYPENLPAPVKFSNRYGEYEATFTVDNGSLIYTRRIKVNKGEFPAESYSELTEFYRNVTKADNAKVVFLNKT
jgi:hypothetical protein